MGLTSITFDYIDDIPSFAVNCVFDLEVVVSTFGGAFNIRLGIKGFKSQAVIVTFLISGGALGADGGSQRRLSSRSILCVIFESSNLARSIRGIKFPDRQKTLTNKTHNADERLTFTTTYRIYQHTA